MIRVPGGPDLSERDERVHVGHGGDHSVVADQGAAGAPLRGRDALGECGADPRSPPPRALLRPRARPRLLRRAASAQGYVLYAF